MPQAGLTGQAPLRLSGSPHAGFPSHSSSRSRGFPPGRDPGVGPLSVTCDSCISKRQPPRRPRWLRAWEHTAKPRGSSPPTGPKRSCDPPGGEEAGQGAPGPEASFPQQFHLWGKEKEQTFGSGQLSASVGTITENDGRTVHSKWGTCRAVDKETIYKGMGRFRGKLKVIGSGEGHCYAWA